MDDDMTPDMETGEEAPRSRKKSQWLLAVGLLTLVLVLAAVSVSLSERSPHGDAPEAVETPGDIETRQVSAPGAGVSDRDVWITKSESEMQNMANELRDLKQKMQQMEAERTTAPHESDQDIQAEIDSYNHLPALPGQPVNAPGRVPQIGPSTPAQGTSITPLPQPVSPPAQPGQATPPPSGGMVVVHMTPPQPEADTTKKADKGAWLAVSFTPATLLNGLDAATGGSAQQNPQPVLMQVTDMTTMPNRYRNDFKECFITGAGYGDISSERAYLRLEKLSCIAEDGHAIEETIDGYVTGEDGKVGMRGRLVSKQGQVLAKALLAGIASGIGDAFTQSLGTQSISPLGATSSIPPGSAARAGIYTGVGKAMNKLADFYIEQANKLYPVIEVDAGRSVDVIINKGVRLPQWNDKEE